MKRVVNTLVSLFLCGMLIGSTWYAYSLVSAKKTPKEVTELDYWNDVAKGYNIDQATMSHNYRKIISRIQAVRRWEKKYRSVYPTGIERFLQEFAHFEWIEATEAIILYDTLEASYQQLKVELIAELRKGKHLDSLPFEEFDRYVFFEQSNITQFFPKDLEIPVAIPAYNGKTQEVISYNALTRGYTPKIIVDPNDPDIIKTQEAFQKMQEAASALGVQFVSISQWRNLEDQKKLFESELQLNGMTMSRFGSDDYTMNLEFERALEKTLTRVAPPGFSRHHTGITVDLATDETKNFENSKAYEWLSKNNFYNAKRFGFVPSYPRFQDVLKYGPNPEAWEYFYVGQSVLLD